MLKKLKNKKGFTLTELIVVIVIIGILAAVLIPSLTGYITKAKKSADEQKVASLNTLLIEVQVNGKDFSDSLELKEYLEDEMDYDGDYSLKVEGSYMWYDTKKRKIVIITEDDDKMNLSTTAVVTLRPLANEETFKFVTDGGDLKSPEGLMQYSSGEEVWLIGGNGYLFDLVEEIRNIGNSGELSEYKKLDENSEIRKVYKKFFENVVFSGTKGKFNVDENENVKEFSEETNDKKLVEAKQNNLAELFHKEVVLTNISAINKTLYDSKAPVELVPDGYNIEVKITNNGLSKAASAVEQIIKLLKDNGCEVGYIFLNKYNSYDEYEKVLGEIVEGYNTYKKDNENNTITDKLYNYINITCEKKENITLADMEKFYKVDLSENVEATYYIYSITVALKLYKNTENVYDLEGTDESTELSVNSFVGKELRLIGVFNSGKYSGLEAQYDFKFEVSDTIK